MRLAITLLVVCLAVVCTARPQDYDYEAEVEAPKTPARAPAKVAAPRGLPNSRQARGPSPLIGRGAAKTTAAPVKVQEPEVANEPEYIDDEELDEEAATPSTTTTTTTVAPKKGVAPVVRPFRSNQDLLAALKRRRQQEQELRELLHRPKIVKSSPTDKAIHGVVTHSTPSPTPSSASAPEEKPQRSSSNNNSNSGRRTFNRANKAPAPVQEASAEVEVIKKPSSSSFNRRFSARAKPTSAPVAAEEEGEEVEEPAPSPRAAKSYRGGRRS